MRKISSFIISLFLLSQPVLAFEIPVNHLKKSSLTLRVSEGHATAIHFENGEVIEHFLISDDTRLIYNTDKPIGEAQTLILREIKPQPTKGATSTAVPNILISTKAPDGSSNLYQFQVQFAKEVSATERVVRVVEASYSPLEQKILTSLGTATLNDVILGLNHVLSTGQASSEDPTIQSIQTCIQLASSMPLVDAANQTSLLWSVLVKLAEIGLQIKSESLDVSVFR